MSSIPNIAAAVPSNVALHDHERTAIIEIAFLAVAADHTISPDEESALRTIAARIHVKGDSVVDGLLSELGSHIHREEADERVRRAAAKLTSPDARAVAYKAAYAALLADLATSDEEFEFDLQLIDALELPQDQVDALTAEVIRDINS